MLQNAGCDFLMKTDLTLIVGKKKDSGPILFTENTNFLREVKLGDDITVELYLEGLSSKAERFKFYHKLIRKDGVLAAEINVYGAWLDMKTRKLTTPPKELATAFSVLEKTNTFEEIILKSK